MKKILAIISAVICMSANAATTVPIQLLSPTFSTVGQAIVSNGPSNPPSWTSVLFSSGGILTGDLLLNYPTSATRRSIIWTNNGVSRWIINNDGTAESGSNTGSNFNISAVSDAGSVLSNPLVINRATGAATFGNVLNATGNDSLTYNNSSAQSIPNNAVTVVTNWTKISDKINAYFNASTGVYTAPATGFYAVSAGVGFAASTSTIGTSVYEVNVVQNGTFVCQGIQTAQTASSVGHSATVSCIISLTTGQTANIQAFQTSGGAVALNSSPLQTYVSINRIP
jgi:hypothetical protein